MKYGFLSLPLRLTRVDIALSNRLFFLFMWNQKKIKNNSSEHNKAVSVYNQYHKQMQILMCLKVSENYEIWLPQNRLHKGTDPILSWKWRHCRTASISFSLWGIKDGPDLRQWFVYTTCYKDRLQVSLLILSKFKTFGFLIISGGMALN